MKRRTVTVAEKRKAYADIQDASGYTVGRDEWKAAVDKIALQLAAKRLEITLPEGQVLSAENMPNLAAQVTPREWLKAAEKATVTCPKCKGSGTYYWGASVNGKMTRGGSCFACGGKGHQDKDDFFRNRCYWQHVKVV